MRKDIVQADVDMGWIGAFGVTAGAMDVATEGRRRTYESID